MTIRSGSPGMTMKTLATRLITSSTSPPLYAARSPSTIAIVIAITVATSATSSEIRPPWITWA